MPMLNVVYPPIFCSLVSSTSSKSITSSIFTWHRIEAARSSLLLRSYGQHLILLLSFCLRSCLRSSPIFGPSQSSQSSEAHDLKARSSKNVTWGTIVHEVDTSSQQVCPRGRETDPSRMRLGIETNLHGLVQRGAASRSARK